ncbi:MAG: hypothetical protein WD825_17135 [Gemmatimonadaceae bacterium]
MRVRRSKVGATTRYVGSVRAAMARSLALSPSEKTAIADAEATGIRPAIIARCLLICRNLKVDPVDANVIRLIASTIRRQQRRRS